MQHVFFNLHSKVFIYQTGRQPNLMKHRPWHAVECVVLTIYNGSLQISLQTVTSVSDPKLYLDQTYIKFTFLASSYFKYDCSNSLTRATDRSNH